MTPYSIEEVIRKADKAAEENLTPAVLFTMLRTLLQHEADKEADRNVQRRANG